MPRRVPRETRRGVELVDIASPYTGTDRVLRRIDSLAQLRGSGIIGDSEMRAADHFRTAYQIVASDGLRCTLDTTPGATSTASRTPSLHAMKAAETLSQAEGHVGKVKNAILHFVVLAGYSIRETATMFPGAPNSRQVGHLLRQALRQLADLWFGPESPPRNHMHREPDARPKAGAIAELVPSQVAHASRKGVSY